MGLVSAFDDEFLCSSATMAVLCSSQPRDATALGGTWVERSETFGFLRGTRGNLPPSSLVLLSRLATCFPGLRMVDSGTFAANVRSVEVPAPGSRVSAIEGTRGEHTAERRSQLSADAKAAVVVLHRPSPHKMLNSVGRLNRLCPCRLELVLAMKLTIVYCV